MYQNYAILAVVVFVYSTLARGIERTPFGGALLFVTLGFIIGPDMLGLVQIDIDRHGLRTIAEFTLALLLFTDAAKADLRLLGRSYQIPWHMLVIGLPLTIALGFVCADWLLPELAGFEMALLATMLAPTDAALGKAVISNKRVPARLRESLNVESGLNDGICVPILFLFLALAVDASSSGTGTRLALSLLVKEIGIGVLVGVLLTLAMSWLLRLSARLGWIGGHWRPIHIVAMALACFSLAQAAGGSGFIASFVGGLLFGALVNRHKADLLRAAEGTGETFSLLTWVLFGGGVIGTFIPQVTWPILLYSLLSLTVIRMLPTLLALIGSGLNMPEKLFLGWFGPRGLASVVFAIIVINEQLPGEKILVLTVVCTVTLSVFLHGLSSIPLANLLAAYEQRRGQVPQDDTADHGS
jgi:NhaP-type Na+/H+ or K+/H+ antiporter